MVRIAFFIFGALWLVGGWLTRAGNMNDPEAFLQQVLNRDPQVIVLHGFFVNICGSLTIILGLVMLAQWLIRKLRQVKNRPPPVNDVPVSNVIDDKEPV